MMTQKRKLILTLCLLLGVSFSITSLFSYFVSRASLRHEIASSELPLTSDTVYSEIQRDLLRPVFISSLMASDTFLRDWVISGESDTHEITKYLREVQTRFGTVTSFFVSEETGIYYHSSGILKKIQPGEERDAWYYRVRDMKPDYEINMDPDLANFDETTIFVNYKVYDYQGRFMGAAGVGLTTDAVKARMAAYKKKYHRDIFFTDASGKLILYGDKRNSDALNIHDMEGFSAIAGKALSSKTGNASFRFKNKGRTLHLNTRYIPELDWFLFVAQTEDRAARNIFNVLLSNLFFCFVITGVVLLLTNFTFSAYQNSMNKLAAASLELKSITVDQEKEIEEQNRELLDKNKDLEAALAEVKTLSGFLPICASCKKIRDDKGYWNQLEKFISQHSEARFTHSICPECSQKLFAELPDHIEQPEPRDDADSPGNT